MTVVETKFYFEISFSFNPMIIAELKRIGDARWNPVRKIWTLPVDKREDVAKLNKRFGNSIIDKGEDYDAIPDLPQLTVDIPLKRDLFAFQKTGVAACLNWKRLIIGDEPGLGKTSQAIATIIAENAFPALIICPATLKYNWQEEFEKVAGIKSLILSDKIKSTWPQYFKVGIIKVFIVNYESLKKYFVDRIDKHEGGSLSLKHIHFKENINLFKSVALDELHRCKDSKTQQSKFAKGIAAGKPLVLGITGTAVVNKPKDLISQLSIIDRLRDFGGYSYFVKRYCGEDGNGSSNLHELNFKLKTTCFYQRAKKDVLTDLPDKIRQIVYCDITTRKEYLSAVNDLATYLQDYRQKSDEQIEKSLRGEIMVRIGICKNISARGKLLEVFEHIDEVIDSGEKIVVFIYQKEIAIALMNRYPQAVTIRGEDDMNARDRNVKAFQGDRRTNIIICNFKAGGVGITLTAASRVAFVELPWHAADTNQCEDRCHRIGQKGSVQCTYFLGKNTIDEDIYRMIESKRTVANTITGIVDETQREFIDKIADSLFKKSIHA